MMTQAQALAILARGDNVFLTGEPGSGKSYTVRQFVAWLRSQDVEHGITASTGIAATHIAGRTIHSWAGLGLGKVLPKFTNKTASDRIRFAKVLILDEVSMLSAELLGFLDVVCKRVRWPDARPFGGLQVVVVGDFFQLPPVNGEFAFTSQAWVDANFVCCYLTEQHRQSEAQFLDMLTSIRKGTAGKAERAYFEALYVPKAPIGSVQLLTHNKEVDEVNDAELALLTSESATYVMDAHGETWQVEKIAKSCGSPQILNLKIGAPVIFTKNDDQGRWANGTQGFVEAFRSHGVLVRTQRGSLHEVGYVEWGDVDAEDEDDSAWVAQVPLRLAWAITVHRSQGMSLEAVYVDLSRAFESGMGYVAFSRALSVKGLSVGGLNTLSLKVSKIVLAKDDDFRASSTAAALSIGEVRETPLRAKVTVVRPELPPARGSLFLEAAGHPRSLRALIEAKVAQLSAPGPGIPEGTHEVELLRVEKSPGALRVHFLIAGAKHSLWEDNIHGFCSAVSGDTNIEVDAEAIEYIVGVENPLAGMPVRLQRVGEKYTWLPSN